MAEARPYYAERGLSATFYDLVTGHDASLNGDIDLYAGLVPPGGSVLELGSGTGRVAMPLAERGLTVTGVEIAPAMLAQAEAKRRTAPPQVAARITYRRGDMTALALGQTFDAVVVAFFSFAHLPGGMARRNALQGIARHLKPGGRAALHLPSSDMLASLGRPDPKRPVMQVSAGDGRTLQLFVRERGFRPGPGRFDQVLEYVVASANGVVQQRSLERQTFYAADPVSPAAEQGLVLEGDPTPLGGVGEVFVFRKT